jgi:type IV pilus assembly protein PilN
MIRINLLGVERQKTRKAMAFDIGQTVTLASSLILVATVLGVGWWFWSLREESSRVDAELVAAQQEAARLQSLLGEVQQFEQQRARLQQRVALIEQLRSGQSIPVQLLDHVSRSVPDMLWLTSMQQEANQVTIEGRSTTLIALSDFVGNLAGGELLQKPIEIVNSQVQPAGGTGAQATPELIQFAVRAQITTPQQAAAQPAGRGARGASGGAARGRQGAPRP